MARWWAPGALLFSLDHHFQDINGALQIRKGLKEAQGPGAACGVD
jgi:hypothetical protein